MAAAQVFKVSIPEFREMTGSKYMDDILCYWRLDDISMIRFAVLPRWFGGIIMLCSAVIYAEADQDEVLNSGRASLLRIIDAHDVVVDSNSMVVALEPVLADMEMTFPRKGFIENSRRYGDSGARRYQRVVSFRDASSGGRGYGGDRDDGGFKDGCGGDQCGLGGFRGRDRREGSRPWRSVTRCWDCGNPEHFSWDPGDGQDPDLNEKLVGGASHDMWVFCSGYSEMRSSWGHLCRVFLNYVVVVAALMAFICGDEWSRELMVSSSERKVRIMVLMSDSEFGYPSLGKVVLPIQVEGEEKLSAVEMDVWRVILLMSKESMRTHTGEKYHVGLRDDLEKVEIETDDSEEVIEDVNVVYDEDIHEMGMVFAMVGDVGVDKYQDIGIDDVVKSNMEMVLDSIMSGIIGFYRRLMRIRKWSVMTFGGNS